MAENMSAEKNNQSETPDPRVLIGEVSERLGPKIEEAQEQLYAFSDRVKGAIRAHPGAVVLGAVGLGFLVGKLASRK